MSLADIIQVQISIEQAALVADGFGVPAIFGTHTRFGERFRLYTKPADMLADGFLTSDPEYLAASALMSQALKPSQFVIAKCLTKVAEVVRLTISGLTVGDVYTIGVNGQTFSYTALTDDTVNTIVGALHTAINAATNLDAASSIPSSTTGLLDITAGTAGIPLVIALSGSGASTMSIAITTPSQGIAEDLGQVRAAGASWYGTLLTSRSKGDILQAAAWVEANSSEIPVILGAQTSESATRDSAYDPAGTDLGSKIKALNYRRTALFWHALDTEYLDAAVFGDMLPTVPGTETWGLKSLSGVLPDSLSSTAKSNLQGTSPGAGKNVNVYYPMTASIFITSRGTMSSGDWIDLIRFRDFLVADISRRVARMMLIDSKVPMTDDGIQKLINQVRGALEDAEVGGKIAASPKYAITFPRAADVSDVDRQARKLPPIGVRCQASGAIQSASVSGTISQ